MVAFHYLVEQICSNQIISLRLMVETPVGVPNQNRKSYLEVPYQKDESNTGTNLSQTFGGIVWFYVYYDWD